MNTGTQAFDRVHHAGGVERGLFGTQALMAAFGTRTRGRRCRPDRERRPSGRRRRDRGVLPPRHWERIFNGFGHLTSGITQELIAIVVLAAVAVAYLVMLRKSDDGAMRPNGSPGCRSPCRSCSWPSWRTPTPWPPAPLGISVLWILTCWATPACWDRRRSR